MITTVDCGGVPVEVEMHGSGTPLLALHGWSVDRRLMTGCLEPVLAAQEGWLRVYPDQPGRGGTPAHPAVDSADATVEVLLALMDAVAPGEPFAVVGESWGGYLARGVLAARPDVLGMALICPVATQGERDLPEPAVLERDEALLAALDPEVRAGFEANNVRQTREVLERYTAEVLPGLAAADDAYLDEVLGPRNHLTALAAGEPATTAPVLVVAGRQDTVVGYRSQAAMAQAWPRATWAVLDGAGHNAQFERTQVFDALLRDWLVRVRVAAGGGAQRAVALGPGPGQSRRSTGLRSTPMSSTSTSMTSPWSTSPTPAGVPVRMTSPGSSVNASET